MKIPYEKWDATGNDFVLVDLDRSPAPESAFTPDLTRAICRRDNGVGADGVVLWKDFGQDQPARVTIWNSDGSPALMCGNALRCVAIVLSRRAGPASRPVLIGQRTVHTTVLAEDRSCVAMGPVAPVGSYPAFSSLDELDRLLGGRGYLLSFGNPHYVMPVAEIPENWAELGARCQAIADRLLGTGGINSGFLQYPSTGEATVLRVFERGVGVTKSCGSGACAASAVLERLGLSPPHRLALLGGVLEIGREGNGGFTLSGPASKKFEGVWSTT